MEVMELSPPILVFYQYSQLTALPTFFLFFITIYLLAYFLIFPNCHPSATRPHASSCFLSFFHGTPALLLSTISLHLDPDLLQRQNPQFQSHYYSNINFSLFASPNTPLQNLTLDYSTAYFLVDLLHYLLFSPHDTLFIAHHAATLYVFLTCRHAVKHGAYPILLLLLLAEVTSACQNAWTLSGFRRRDSPAAAVVYGFLSPVLFAVYTVVRGVVGPVVVWEMGVFYLRGGGDGVVPLWAWGSWMVVIVIAVLVSILWVWSRWLGWCAERRKKD